MTEGQFKIQEEQYDFPYHYIPYFKGNSVLSRHRFMDYGYEYMCYLLHIVDQTIELQPNSILDVGCGEGRFLGLVKNNIEHCVGVDLSLKALRFARAFHPDLTFHNVNANELSASFDLVTAIEVLEHISDKDISAFLQTLCDRTKKNGHCLLSVPTKNMPLAEKHYRHYTLDRFKQDLAEAGSPFKILETTYIFQPSFILKIYYKLSWNRFWALELKFLWKILWKYVWNSLRVSNAKHGQHLILLLKPKR